MLQLCGLPMGLWTPCWRPTAYRKSVNNKMLSLLFSCSEYWTGQIIMFCCVQLHLELFLFIYLVVFLEGTALICCFFSPLSSSALVPDSVKKELLTRIRAFLAQHATLWTTAYVSSVFHFSSPVAFFVVVVVVLLFFLTCYKSTSYCLFSIWASQMCCIFFGFGIMCFHMYFTLFCSIFGQKKRNKVMTILWSCLMDWLLH